MSTAPLPDDEAQRLAALMDLVVLDSPPEPLFDTITRLASDICGTPIALISLIDAERQWFKANVGLEGVHETPRDVAFCAHAISDDTLMEVPDATLDARFSDNPLVTGGPHIRFYAGAPLVLPSGAKAGTLCVIDRAERQLDASQARSLRMLATLVSQALVMRRDLIHRSLTVSQQAEEAARHTAELQREQALRAQVEQHARELDLLLHEREDMLDVLSHEVRQPLNNASAALQSAGAVLRGLGDQAASVRLGRAQAVMGQVLASIDNTLAAAALLASQEAVELADTDVDTLVAVAIADVSASDRTRIVVDRRATTRTVSADMGLMRLALRNLLLNALKYSPADTAVVVRLIDWDEPLAFVIEVEDAGPGFAADLTPRLFQRGARGRHTGAAKGHGLGLYIVRRVMEMHGGAVELARHSAQGSVLRLVIKPAQ